jgi:hypothetical protein
MYFVNVYENRTMKPVEIVLRMGAEGWGRMMEEVDLIKTHCKHVCKCHNEPPWTTSVQLIYADKM